MKKTLVLSSLISVLPLLPNFAAAASIHAEIQARPIIQKAMSPEAITISEDGNQITFIARSLEEFSSAPPTAAWLTRRTDKGWSEPEKLPIHGMVTSIAFARNDQWLVVTTSRGTPSGYLKIFKYLFSDRERIGNLEGFDHRIEILDAKNPSHVLFSLKPADVGLEKPEMLKHARLSPDGKWLAFYTHGVEEQRGIHVFNLETRKVTHLGSYDDKHPTWTPDGSKILFHNQSGGDSFTNPGGDERSVIGYYELDFSNGDLQAHRVLMDSKVEGFAYQKHPSVYPGTDLLFFHGSLAEGKAKKLFVRRLHPDSKIYKLSDLMSEGLELKSVKHANSSVNPSGIYFVGKLKGAATTGMRNKTPDAEFETLVPVQDLKDIYWISNEEIQKINQRVK